MKDICAADQTELDKLIYEFPDEALEIAAVTGGEKVGNCAVFLSQPLRGQTQSVRDVCFRGACYLHSPEHQR
jgi:hypothetical protein